MCDANCWACPDDKRCNQRPQQIDKSNVLCHECENAYCVDDKFCEMCIAADFVYFKPCLIDDVFDYY